MKNRNTKALVYLQYPEEVNAGSRTYLQRFSNSTPIHRTLVNRLIGFV